MTSPSFDGPREFVADLFVPNARPPARTVTNVDSAAQEITTLLRARCQAVLARYPGRPIIMLSGGVDSITLLAILASLECNPYCVTVSAMGYGDDEVKTATRVASHFNASHHIIKVDPESLYRLTVEAVTRIDNYDIWEVGAAIPLLAVFQHLAEVGERGPVFNGQGADRLLAGGSTPPEGNHNDWCTTYIWQEITSNFIYQLNIPDYYRLLLDGDADRLISTFQTRQLWEATSRWAFPTLFQQSPQGHWIDKVALRKAAVKLGVPDEFAYRVKDPIQSSSGLFTAFARQSRARLATDPNMRPYTNPEHEPSEMLLARWWLYDLATRSQM